MNNILGFLISTNKLDSKFKILSSPVFIIRAQYMDCFWNKVDIKNADECWNWKASKTRNGYGSFAIWNGERHYFRSHRFAWILWQGEDPGYLLVCHTCDNRLCCNPHHMFLGTHKDNHQDKLRKGRDHNQKKTHCKNGHEFTKENTKITSRNTRECRICSRHSAKMCQRKRRLRFYY